DQIVSGVRDDDITVGSNRHPRRCGELSQDRGATVAELAGLARTGHGPEDVIRGRQLSNSIVSGIGDVEVGLVVEGQGRWRSEESGCAENAVAVTGISGSGHGCQRPGAEVVAPDGIIA